MSPSTCIFVTFDLQINAFLGTYKMVDRSLLYRFFGVHGNTFNSFLLGQNQEKCNNPTYTSAYLFFEKLRIYFGEGKSAARLFNEAHYPDGFCTINLSKRKQQQQMKNRAAVGIVDAGGLDNNNAALLVDIRQVT